MRRSLEALGRDSVDIFYLHKPDPRTPFEEQIRTCNELHKEGKFKELGLSNFAAWQVVQICEFCARNDLISPTVYQGMYNPLARKVEEELVPALRAYGIRFFAYNPLAGGLLARPAYHASVGGGEEDGADDDRGKGGRFGEHFQGKTYRQRYMHDQFLRGCAMVHAAVRKHNAACEGDVAPVTLAAATLRW